MLTDVDTETVAAPDRFALWDALAAKSHMRNLLRTEYQDDFRGKMRVLNLGDMQISAMSFPQLEVLRTARLITQHETDILYVGLVLNGEARASQAGREAKLGPGELLLMDCDRPFQGDFSGTLASRSHLIVVQFPRRMLPLPEKVVRDLVAAPIPARYGMGAVTRRWLVDLVGRAAELGPADVPTLTRVTTELLAATLSWHSATDDTLTPDGRRRALRLRIRDFIRLHLHDPSLSPGSIAAAHQISVRHLHELFAGEELAVAALIRHLRLERCRRELADPGNRHRPVRAIAERWGFVDPAHFSRTFRAAYGIPPGRYRRQALDER